MVKVLAEEFNDLDLDTPFKDLPEDFVQELLIWIKDNIMVKFIL